MSEPAIIPEQRTGSKTGASSRLQADSRHQAIQIFKAAKSNLLDINHWDKFSGKGSAVFQLTDNKGNLLHNIAPKVGDLIRIDLPAPGNEKGHGYDWVRIEKFEDSRDVLKDEEIFGFRVRPVKHPDNTTPEAAHFYTSDATSTFLIIRNTNTITAMERARNEVPNTGVFSFLNKIRNTVIALAAMAGLSNPQWKRLMKGVLQEASRI
jgi:hypothetical protein